MIFVGGLCAPIGDSHTEYSFMWFVSSRWRLLNALGNTKRLPIAVFIFVCLLGLTRIAARIQLRLLQSDIVVETKTKDNVSL